MLNPDDILSAAAIKLQADATIKGASYLNGATKIAKGPALPEGQAFPFLLLSWSLADFQPSGAWTLAEIQATVFCDANANGTANLPLMARILKRVDTLLTHLTETDWSRTGVRIFQSETVQPFAGPFDSPDYPEKHYAAMRVEVSAIQTAA